MKQITFLIIALSIYCSKSTAQIPENATIDARFVGTWTGETSDSLNFMSRSWTQNRKENGKYKIKIIQNIGDRKISSTERGYWWVIGDKFYEQNTKVMTRPDEYQFQFLNADEVKFIMKSMDNTSMGVTEDYSFIDKRIKK